MARVLVVDDDAATRTIATAILDTHHHVYSAKHGREAFAVLRATPHQLIRPARRDDADADGLGGTGGNYA